MPYENKDEKRGYDKGFYAGYKKATIDHLVFLMSLMRGRKQYDVLLRCSECGTMENLEIDHIRPLHRKARSLKDLKDLSNLQILCTKCNSNREFKK